MRTPNKASLRLENKPLAQLPAPERLLVLLKRGGPAGTAALAARLGITGEAARQQLVQLHSEGLVEATAKVQGRGRPLQVWHLTPAAHRRFPDAHGELAAQLIEAVRRTLGEPALDRLIEAREQQLLGAYSVALAGATNLRERLERLVSLRNAEGYMAECQPERGGYRVVENHCPICAASGACLKLCRSELELFHKLLGPKVSVERDEHIGSGSRRCVYHVRRRRPSAAAAKTKPAAR